MAIPEFILKKLIVPGSFKSNPKGFSFKILNSFAPAVISRFNIFVASQQVPDELISLSSSDMPAIKSSDIQPESPISLAVGIEISVMVTNFPVSNPIRIKAMTKEVGEIEFSLTETTIRKKKTSLKPSLFLPFKKPKRASFTINMHEIQSKFSPFILGQFVEHLENCVYGGIWTDDGSKIREDTLDLIRQLNPPIIRYPGGNFASGYHWEDGIGPRNKRPTRHDLAWQVEESNQVGTDEFLAFCEAINAEPCLVVNDGSGSPEEAAKWVAYCNAPEETEQGARRAKNGHPQPYNVKYWGIGNEVWGPWQIGTTTAEEYSRRAARFIIAMREVDPEIKVIAVGNNPLTDDPDDPAAQWNTTVLKSLGNQIDYLSWHIYQPEKSGWKESYDAMELYKAVCAASLDMESIIERVQKQIQKEVDSHKVLQAVDEWNLWLPPREKNVSMHHVTYTMRDALYVSSVLTTFLRHSNTVGMANLAQLVNVLPLIQTNSDSAIATAIFYPFVLFSQLQNNVLRTTLNSELFNSQPFDINMTGHSSVPYLDGIAACNDTKEKLNILLINRYPFDKLSVTLDLQSGNEFHPFSALEISARSPESFNNFRKPFEVRITDANLPKINGSSFQILLKPCSVYMVEFHK